MIPNLETSWPSRAPGREKPKKPFIIIPPTPINARHDSLSQLPEILSPFQYSVSSTVTPVSPAPLSFDLPSMETTIAESAASPDIIAIAELFATLKRTVKALNTSFHRLENQTIKMAGLAPAMKAAEQIEDVRAKLEHQIARHETTMQGVRSLLESTVKESLLERLKSQIYAAIKDTVTTEINERVEQELLKQIPLQLRQQGQAHQRQILEAKTSLHNSEARHHNASLRSPSMTEPLRPLLRPLPSAAQSPAYVVKRPIPPTSSTIATPMTAFPVVPASTPLTVAAPTLMIPRGSSQVFELVPPTPSPLFPRDLKSLFSLGPDAAKRLLHDYGIDHTRSPSSEELFRKAPPRGRTDSAIDLSPILSPDAVDSREHDINHFMAHIGVPLLMVPAPKRKGGQTSTLSSPVDQRSPLPLVISSSIARP